MLPERVSLFIYLGKVSRCDGRSPIGIKVAQSGGTGAFVTGARAVRERSSSVGGFSLT